MGDFGFGKRKERKTAANKPGLSRLTVIMGPYVGLLAPRVLSFSSSVYFEKSSYFSLLVKDMAHFLPCSSIQTKTIKTAKDHHSSMVGS